VKVANGLLISTTISDLEWPWTAWRPPTRAISAVAELLVNKYSVTECWGHWSYAPTLSQNIRTVGMDGLWTVSDR